MESGGAKGTVTSLSSLFPAEDAHKAATRVQGAILEKHRELGHLQGFISDNANLINLVQKLPEELYHEVMVPFGKAAFFPGRLIHTNEFLVLLGEGYYAGRTSKQTVEILKRRGKALDSQVDSMKAMMDDLRAQASFFDATASEAAEGLVEIKEEYVEKSSREQESESGVNKQDIPGVDKAKIAGKGDEVYARIMSRLDELEKEEDLASDHGVKITEEVEYARIMSRLDELEKEEELAAANIDQSDEEDEEEKETSNLSVEKFHDDKHSYSKPSTSVRLREENISKEVLDKYQQQREASTNPSNCSGLSVQSSSKDMTGGNNPMARTQQAFTGSIVERPPIIPKAAKQESETPLQGPSGSQPSKPVSRFKMQRR